MSCWCRRPLFADSCGNVGLEISASADPAGSLWSRQGVGIGEPRPFRNSCCPCGIGAISIFESNTGGRPVDDSGSNIDIHFSMSRSCAQHYLSPTVTGRMGERRFLTKQMMLGFAHVETHRKWQDRTRIGPVPN